MELKIGIKHTLDQVVTEAQTASAVGSGDLRVYATPMMVALMENASASLVEPYLNDGESTVGTKLNINHTAASPVGSKITATATLTGIDNRRLVFKVEARDQFGIIGDGTHERFIINKENFLNKLSTKKGDLK